MEQRYQAVLAVIGEGETVKAVAARFGVARKTVHVWLARYEAGGLENLGDRSHRPVSCPHQMPADVEVCLAEMTGRGTVSGGVGSGGRRWSCGRWMWLVGSCSRMAPRPRR